MTDTPKPERALVLADGAGDVEVLREWQKVAQPILGDVDAALERAIIADLHKMLPLLRYARHEYFRASKQKYSKELATLWLELPPAVRALLTEGETDD